MTAPRKRDDTALILAQVAAIFRQARARRLAAEKDEEREDAA